MSCRPASCYLQHELGCRSRTLLQMCKIPHRLNHWCLYHWLCWAFRSWGWASTGLGRPMGYSPMPSFSHLLCWKQFSTLISSFLKKKKICLYSYLTAPGLSCGMWDLVCRPGPLALGTRSLSHWTSKKVSSDMFWFLLHQNLLLAQSWYNRSVFSFAKVFYRPFCPSLHSPKMLNCIILFWIFKIWNSENQSSLQ